MRRSFVHVSAEVPGEVRGACFGTGSRLARTPASDEVADFPNLGKAGHYRACVSLRRTGGGRYSYY